MYSSGWRAGMMGGGLEDGAEGSLYQNVMKILGRRAGMKGGGLEMAKQH